MRCASLLILAACVRHVPEADPVPSPLEELQARAAVDGPDQVLERCRLASVALAEGRLDLAESALRQAVGRMQDFRAEGEFRAMVGAEDRKEWKGDPYEKMMAFLYLGLLLQAEGDGGNALAMTKSAILADTGTSRFQYRSDFVPAFVLQGLVYDALGEPSSAERSLRQAADAMVLRELTTHLSDVLAGVEVEGDADAVAAAKVLLLSGLPAGLAAHPTDVDQALSGALSRATDLRMVVLDGARADRPEELGGLRRGDVRRSLDLLSPLVLAWKEAAAVDAAGVLAAVQDASTALTDLAVHPPRVVLFVERGRGPLKVADGEYGEILRIVPRRGNPDAPPDVRLDGVALSATYLDSTTWQASTRGSRWVDGFLRGKAVFKDASPLLGSALMVSGDVARALEAEAANQDSTVSTVLYVLGGLTWLVGVVANPAADVRAWTELPDTLWLVTANPAPGRHALAVGGRQYTVDVPDQGTVVQLLPALPPGGVPAFGTPCVRCEHPMAIPAVVPEPRPEPEGAP